MLCKMFKCRGFASAQTIIIKATRAQFVHRNGKKYPKTSKQMCDKA